MSSSSSTATHQQETSSPTSAPSTSSQQNDLLTQIEAEATSPMHSPFQKFLKSSVHSQRFLCGIASGTITALLFNPWDRALYLSVISQRSFFSIENWKNPFVGSSQSMVIRTISGSMFFPLKEWFDEKIILFAQQREMKQNDMWVSFLSGNMAGAVNGVALNSINAVKYHTWSTKKGFFGTIAYMYRKGGITPFLRGQSATVVRDTVFGGVYAIVKHAGESTLQDYQRFFNPDVHEPEEEERYTFIDRILQAAVDEKQEALSKFAIAFFAATVGTIISAPLNYTRNLMFGTKPGERIPTSSEILRDLWRDSKNQNQMNKLRYISMRFRLGAATTRVGCGMAVGQRIYDTTKKYLFQMTHDENFQEEEV
uniref:ADP,ATP carrier protein n=1 Tax=Percolomonas cosmopolitus TaxID=63605 RepID=A0A7S1KLY5_9EUKA|mmetsp:Transcript_11493/g.43131  ORF Transcript_11493/g.43131 Transcript_11493/m.43131 type:complete len:368 (+) Transcript_11493:493-1596(+)|eukprot:CAMPEP_0117451198 /NCGR_PEP_ID=MMETSP0759-20121206/8881_1 /TAXON_ID=63605 /ORGANISM="Percolomonas cosmopolitus, Strain WS" /LENGTH=367 /DNA_ID=CAMNT_0005243785 /DNA_START=211 /DNA_END=1314 /DNA_ORIENTATION=+